MEKRIPLSSAQRRLYLQCQLPGGDRAYHLLYLARVRGSFPLEEARLFASRMIARHESLRSSFHLDGGDFVSVVHKEVNFDFTIIEGKESDLEEIIELYDQPFRLEIPPLFRIIIVRLGEAENIIIFNCHHLVFDGYSGGILDQDILDELAGRGLTPIERTYSDFVQWEQDFFQSKAYGEQKDFWRAQYPKAPERLRLPLDFTPPAAKSFEGDYFIRYLDLKEVKQCAMSQGATLFAMLLAAFYAVLHTITGQQEITVGTLVSPRESGRFQNVIGLFANTLPLTAFPDAATSFTVLLHAVRTTLSRAMQHADFPFEHLVSQLPFLEKGERNPLFDLVFNFERVVRRRDESAFRGVAVEQLDYYAGVSMFDLAIDIVEFEDRIRFRVEFATALFRKESIEGLMDAYFAIIRQLCITPDILLGDLRMVSEDALRQILQWNDTGRTLKEGHTFLHTWDQQTARYADNPALRMHRQEMNYRQLEERANRLAHHLIDLKIGRGDAVAVALDRSPEWVVALLAIWKAGGVYLPLSLSHPRTRIMHQLSDSRALLVITEERHHSQFAGLVPVLAVDAPETARHLSLSGKPDRTLSPSDPAYIIYTSGSTGAPKGVLVDHRAVHAHMDAVKGVYRLQPDDNLLQFSSPVFDASLEQILIALSSGACLVLPESQLNDPRAMLDLLLSEEITIAEFPPAYLQELLPYLDRHALRKIRGLISGGDVLKGALACKIMDYLPPDARLLNFYGPTEATMAATVFQLPGNPEIYDSWRSVPIGKPLPNTRIYILDSNCRLLPPGIPGELCIAGDRLARGYLNLDALTAEKFVQIDLPGRSERVYRTGDRARWLSDGTIEFLKRIDKQIQLRGYRIEPGEIEQVLLQHPQIIDALVVKNGDALIACLVPANRNSVNAALLYEWLKGYLPEYMIPAGFVFMEAIPENAAGKADRQALPGLADACRILPDDAPFDSFEWELWHIWRDILKIPHIGRNDIFFHIGGNSLSAIQVMVVLKNRYQVDIPLSLILRNPTIAILADFLRNREETVRHSCVVPLNPDGELPPIIMIPGLGGNVIDLYELATGLDKRFPCYGMQHPWDSGSSGINDSIERLASCYLEELERVISLDDCILLGHSFGGYVACEMARILQRRERPPKSLILLDVATPQGGREPVLTERELLELTVRSLMGTGDDAGVQNPDAPAGDAGGDESERALALLKSANRLPQSLSLERFRNYLETIAMRFAAFSSYQPASRVDTETHLFRAEVADESQPCDADGGSWAVFTGGSFTLHRAAGDHFSMIKGECAMELAGRINLEINKFLEGGV